MAIAERRGTYTSSQPGGRPALLILDMINSVDFEGAEDLLPHAISAAHRIDQLRQEFRQRGWPVVYVNDNFGEWRSEASVLVARALERDNSVTELLKPGRDDYFIIKPQFSGFYATNLPVLLQSSASANWSLVVKLVLGGVATNICVRFTAADAHMREYDLWVPKDAVAGKR